MMPFRVDVALALVRIMLGVVFVAHGSQKVLGIFGGSGLQQFVSWITSLGVPAIFGYAAALCELFGGLMLLFGIASRLGALMIIPVMVAAIILVHLKSGFFGPQGFEYPLVLLICALAIFLGGSGAFALFDW